MSCPHCAAAAPAEQPRRTCLGYRTFRCRTCRRAFNERTGTPYNHLQYPTDLVLLVVLWRLRYKLSLRDLAEMFLERGFVFSHEAVRDWEARFAPLLTARLRAKRRGQGGTKWHADETYVKVDRRWCSYGVKLRILARITHTGTGYNCGVVAWAAARRAPDDLSWPFIPSGPIFWQSPRESARKLPRTN